MSPTVSDMNGATQPSSGPGDIQRSLIYREFQAEREEILKHKWLESEKAGRDVGFEWALTDWTVRHRSNWLKTRRSAAASC